MQAGGALCLLSFEVLFASVLIGIAALICWLILQARDVPSGTGGQAVVDMAPRELARCRDARDELSRIEYVILRQDLNV